MRLNHAQIQCLIAAGLLASPAIRRTSTTHEERYTHFRVMPADSKYQAVTVFSRKEEGRWFHTYAKCLKGDQFSRELGRKIARRHYFANRYTDHITFGPQFDYHDLAVSVGAIVPEQQPDQLAA